MKKMNFKLCAAAMVTALSICQPALAVNVAGFSIDDTAVVGQQKLQLNGAGIRYKAIFKVYVAALYLADKKTTGNDVIAAHGVKRVNLVMLRDVSSEELSNGFLNSIKQNLDPSQKANIMGSMYKLGSMFSSVPELVKGTVITIDMIPSVGLSVTLNGQKMGEPIADMALCDALLKVWVGEKPVDSRLKQALLGDAPNQVAKY